MTPLELALYPFLLLAGLGVGLLLGRRTNPVQQHVVELESEIEGWHKENERVAAELRATREELQRREAELGSYREQVADHFSGTAERLRELTFQYRAMYEHLAGGARELCADRFLELEEGAFSPGALPPASASTDAADESDASATSGQGSDIEEGAGSRAASGTEDSAEVRSATPPREGAS